MVFFWRKKTKQKPQKKSAKKPRSKTFILEEIISPGAYCPAPLDDSLLNHPIFGLFTDQELTTTIFGPGAPPNIADIDTESLVQDCWEKIDQYFQENPSEADTFDINNLSTWPTLEALINPGQPSVEIPDVGGAVDTLPPPVTVPIDPPRNNPGSGSQDPVITPPQPPTLVNAISDITLTPEISSQTIDISQVFATPDGEQLKYEVINNNNELLNLNLENNQLSIEALPKTGESQITIQATTDAGGVAAHTFKVFNNYVAPESVATINSGLTELQNVIDTNPDDLLASLDTPEAQTALETLATELESNFDNIFNAIQQPETLTRAGVSPEAVATLEQILASEEVGAALGLPTSVESALENNDFRIWDNYLINATEAASILLPDAPQTNVAFLDFADGHGENVTEVFESVNPNSEYERLSINNGNWAQQLVQYVDNLKAAGKDRGIANLSFDLSQADSEGRVTTRYDLTEAEQLAIQYARDNNVLLVAASGNTGGEMSALGKAAEKFDNIITVGAVNKLEEVADYSSRGDTLTLVAPGGQYENDPNAFVGTSRATSYVTGAASLVWAANPELSYQQVKELLTLTAKDLGPEGWDAETGAGLLDVTEAVLMAGLVAPEAVVRFGDVDISAFTGAGRVNVDIRAASPETEAAIQGLTDTQNQLLGQWQVLRDLGNDDATLEELQNEIASRKSEALDSYRDVDTAAAISLVKNQESLTALGLAREHYQIELGRLQGLLERQGQLQDGLVALTGERDELVVANEEQLRVLEEAIARTEQELDDARKKLQYQLVDPDTLVADIDAVKAEITDLGRKITDYRQQSAVLKAQADDYYAQATDYRQQQGHYINIADSHRPRYQCRGYSLGGNPGLQRHYQNLADQAARNAEVATLQGDVFQVDHSQLEQLLAQMEEQNQALKDYEKLLEINNQQLSQLTGQSDDAHQILEALQKQAVEKTQQAEEYWQQAELAEQRRLENQDKADWHEPLTKRWEAVGYRHQKKSGNRLPIYGWREYPEHIAARDQAQKQADNAEQERQIFEQWARQAQAEADELNAEATALGERVGDWSELKEGIEHEINAKQQQLQAEKDLLALQTPVQQQQLETLELEIAQSEAELQKLETEQLPEQHQKANATEERLSQVQQDVEANQIQRSLTQADLQNFLETYGYLLPYQERRSAVQKQIQQLTEEKVIAQQLLLQLQTEVANNPNNNVTSQLESTQNYLNDIEQQLAWAKVQEEQLNLSAPDSPQRLAIGNLIDELAKRQQNLPETNTLPLQEYIDFLRGVENRNNNLLNGFDDLEERLTAAQTQQTATGETLQRLQEEYRDLGLAKADLETEKLLQNQIDALQRDVDPQQEILDGYRQQISDASEVATNFEELRQQYQEEADWWNSQASVFNEGSYLTHNPDVANAVRRGWLPNAWYHYVKYGQREGRLPNPQAIIERDLAQAAANNATEQRDAATLQAQQVEASLQPNIYAAQTTIAALESKQQIFTDIENIQPNATLEEAIALKESQIDSTKTAISQVQDTINGLENNLAVTKQAKSDKEAEIVGQEGAIAQTKTDIGTTEANITAKQAETTQQQSALQGYHNQINQANAVTNNFEQQRQQHEANANYWNERINTWGVTGYEWETYSYKSGKKWKTGQRQVPVYGWVYDPQAEANRDAELAAANNTAQQRDLATQQAQQLTTTLQPQIEATEANITQLQTDKQNLEVEKQNLQTELSNQQQELENLQSELGVFEQNIGNIESDIATNEQTEDELDAQLLKESSEKIYLQETLAGIDQGIADKESEISDKYEEIELTEKYARHVNTEVDRLENRVKLLNEGDALEADYRELESQWEEAIATQVAATEALLTARQEGEEERNQLLSLQSELAETQTELATATQQQETLETTVADTQQDLEFTEVQLVTQELRLESLQGQDEPLRSAEANFYEKAQESREKIWYWDGSTYVHNEERAEEYRTYLQEASRLADQRNNLWPQIEETEKKIEELQQDIATKQADLANKESEFAAATPKVANLTAKVGEIEADIAPLVTALEPLQQEEATKLQEFQTAVQAAVTIGQQLATTTQDQADALNRLIGFGVLGTESDVDFFATQVGAKVDGFIDELQNRSSELGAEGDKLGDLIVDWQEELDNTTDGVSRQALTDLITQTIGQQNHLLERQQENQEIVTALSDRLTAATASLENLRQQQELEIREQINSNDERLEALNRQLETETAAEKAVNEDTVLAYAQLNDQVRADLTASATQWVSQLLEGHQQTKEIGESQQNLSQSVDELIQYIEENLADVDGERDRNLADLRDAITTLGVVAPRRDELVAGETTLKQEIEKLKLWIEQDAKLWSEIAPIVERFGAESKELAEYQPQSELIGEAREILGSFFELEREKEERLKLSEDYDYFENPENGSRYFFTGSKNWYAAQEEAEKVGGNLVTIRNQQEQDFLRQTVGGQRVWIGLNDLEREGHWRWASGEPVTFWHFYPGEPNNRKGREHAVEFTLRSHSPGRWNDVPHYESRRGLVEVTVKDLEAQQQEILDNLVKWAEENNALDQISDIARQILDEAPDKPHYKEQLESLSHHLAEYNRFKTEQLAESAKATELRQGWEEAVNFDSEKIVRTEFNNKLVESVRADDNYTYNRYSTDGGQTWSDWQNNNSNSKADDIKLTEVDGQLYQVVRRTNNHVYVRNSDNGADWSSWKDIGAGPTSGEFAIDAIGDRLVVSVRHANNQIYTRAINNENWQPWNHTEVPTIGEFSQEIIDGRLVQSYKGVDDRTYVRNSLNGVEWAQWSTAETATEQSDWRLSHLPGVSEQDFVDKPENISEVEFGDKIVQSLTADNKEVYTRHSSDGGETWREWKHTGGHANSNVKQLTLNDKVFQVIKGTNDAVYIRNSSDGENWTGWGKLSGAVVGDFQVEAFADQLVLSIRGTDNKIHTRHATNGTSWSGWHTANVRAITDIQQEAVDDKLVQSYRGTDDQIYTRYSSDGQNWSTWETLPEAIASSDWRLEYLQQLGDSSTHQIELEDISEIEFGDKIVQSRTADNKEVQTRHSQDGGATWTEWKHTGGHANSNVKQLTLNNKVYQVIKGTDNAVHIRNSTNGENWTGWGKLSGAVVGDFQIEAIDNKLVLAIRGTDNKIRSRYATNNTSGNVWSGWHTASVHALTAIHQELVDGKLVQSYRGTDDEIYTRYSSDGSNWQEWETLPEAIASSDWREEYLRQLAESSIHKQPENISEIEFGDKIVQSRTAENKDVQMRYSQDGGATWTEWKDTGGNANSDVKQLTLNGKLFQVMKATNDAVYIRNSSNGENWTGWSKLSGAILGDFQVEAMEDRLVLSIRSTDNKIYTRHATNGTSWSGWEAAPTKTLEDFSQKIIDGKLVQSYLGTDGNKHVRHSEDGVNWSDWDTVDAAMEQAEWRRDEIPDVAEDSNNLDLDNVVSYDFNDRTVQLVRDDGNDSGKVYERTSTDGGKTWTDWKYSNIQSNADEIEILATSDRLFQVVRHPNNVLYVRHSNNGENWSGWIKTSSWGATDDFKVDVIDDELVIGIRHRDTNHVHTRSFNGSRWKNWDWASHPSLQDLSQEVVGDRLIQTYRGLNDIVYTRHTKNGEEWTDWTPIDEVLATSEWEQKNLEGVRVDGEKIGFADIDTVEFNGTTTQTAKGPENKVYQRQSTDGGQTWNNWGYISMHNQESTPRTFALEDRVFQVVHNPNNHIYFRSTLDGRNWSGWNNIGGPSADVETNLIDNRLVISQQNHNDRIYTRTVDDKQWTGWEIAPTASINGIQQEVRDGLIHQTYQGIDDKGYTRSSADGLTWTDWGKTTISQTQWQQEPLNFEKVDTVEFNGTTTQTARGPENKVYQRQSTDGGKTWSNWGYASMHNQEATPRTFVLEDRVFQVVHNPNNHIYFRSTLDGRNWTGWGRIGGPSADVETTLIDNRLVISQQNHNDRIYTRTVDDKQWTGWEIAPTASINGIQQETKDGLIHQTYQGIDGKGYTRSSADGLTWSGWTETAISTTQWQQEPLKFADIDTVEFNGTTTQTARGPENKVYQRQSTDGGKTWSNWGYISMHNQESTPRTFVLEDRVFQVVHNPNNRIYFRWTGDGRNWSGWSDVGSGIADVKTTLIDNRLVISQQNYNDRVYTRTVDDKRWTNWEIAPVATTYEVHQEIIDNRLVQSYRGMDDQLYTRHSSDGLEWSHWTPIEEVQETSQWEQENVPDTKTDFEAIALEHLTNTEFNGNQIQTVADDRGYIYRRHSVDGGNTWTDWQYANIQTQEDNVRTVQVGDRLFQLQKHPNNTIYAYDSLDGVNWRSRGAVGGPAEGDYSIDVVGDELVFAMRHASNNQIYTRTVNTQGMSPWNISTVATINDIQQEVADGTITQSYLGVDNDVYTRQSTDGKNWTEWHTHDPKVRELKALKEEHLPQIVDDSAALLRPVFLDNHPENGTAIDVLQDETADQAHKYESQIATLKAEESQNNAQASAALAQADWYEQQAATHWELSRKNGPTWTERRQTWKRNWRGKKKKHWVTITHVDHHWILWDTYTKYAENLRKQAVSQLVETDNQSQQQERFKPLAEQWANTRNAASTAEAPIDSSRNLVDSLAAAQEQIPVAESQLQEIEELLPYIEELLAEAQKEADEINAKVLAEWEEQESIAPEYLQTVEDILERRGELNKQSQELQNQLADTEKWVEQQTVALDTETEQVDKLRQELIADGETLAEKIAVATGSELTELQTKQAQLQDALGLLDNKAVVLRQQQTAFSQKRTLLTAENEVILAEQRLLDAYLTSPDSDFEELQQQLADARAALAEAQRLAEQAEASSQVLTAPLQEVQQDLLAQNDEHLQAAKERQQILKDLLEATELNANYTLEAAQKQQEVNDLEFQILQWLQEVTAAGNEEAKHLLEVATQNDMATAAELYYRDYRDLAGDKRSSSAGGVGTAEDKRLADKYYQEMLKYQELQRLAQEQADHFGEIRQTAEAQLETLQEQQETAAQTLQDINEQINEAQEQGEAKEEELAVAQARLDGIARIREQTEQTFVHLVSLEQLNLAQAQLEQEIAEQRQSDIDEAVAQRMEREQIELERQRLEARAKLEQLEQLQAEEELRQAVNQVRADVGLDAVAGGSDVGKLSSDMATLLGQLQDLEERQPDLPDDVKALLADARGDIHSALQGEEAENIQKNLLKAAEGLVGQVQYYETEMAKLEQEEQWDAHLFAQAGTDLQAASREFIEEVQRAELLSGEREIINPLYIETLSKVAYAEQAIEISEDLANQSKDILNQILKQRKEERKARRKAFFNELLSVVILVVSIIAAVLTLGASLAASATLMGMSTASMAATATTLRTIASALSAVQAAYNDDWGGAVFNAVMAAVSYGTGDLTSSMNAAKEAGNLVKAAELQLSLDQLNTFGQITSGAFKGIRAMESGDSTMAFLQFASAAASVAVGQVQLEPSSIGYQVLNSLQDVPIMVHSGVQAIENDDWLSAAGNIFNAVTTLGQNIGYTLGGNLTKSVVGFFNDAELAGNLGLALAGVVEDDSLVGILSGINSGLNAVNTYYQKEDALEGELKRRSELERRLEEAQERKRKELEKAIEEYFANAGDQEEVHEEEVYEDVHEVGSEGDTDIVTEENNEANQDESGETNSTDSVAPSSEDEISQEAIEKAEEIDKLEGYDQGDEIKKLDKETQKEVTKYLREKYGTLENWLYAQRFETAQSNTVISDAEDPSLALLAKIQGAGKLIFSSDSNTHKVENYWWNNSQLENFKNDAELLEEFSKNPISRKELLLFYQNNYKRQEGTLNAGFHHQMLNLAEDGPDSSIVNWVLYYSAMKIQKDWNSGSNFLTSTLDSIPPYVELLSIPFTEKSLGLSLGTIGTAYDGFVHLNDHLAPALDAYVHRKIELAFQQDPSPSNIEYVVGTIRNEHEQLLEKVVPGFDEVGASGEIGWLPKEISQIYIPISASDSREDAIDSAVDTFVEKLKLDRDKYPERSWFNKLFFLP